jgi:hypothetical protein
MSNTVKESQNLFQQIPGLEDITKENAAAVSGGNLILSDLPNGFGLRRTLVNRDNHTLGVRPPFPFPLVNFNNRASWYRVTGNRDWVVYTGTFAGGSPRFLRRGTSGNLTGIFNNNIESAYRVG